MHGFKIEISPYQENKIVLLRAFLFSDHKDDFLMDRKPIVPPFLLAPKDMLLPTIVSRSYMSISKLFFILISLWASAWQTAEGIAAVSLKEQGSLALEFKLKAGFGYFYTENTNFGPGRFDLKTGANTGDAQWSEGYIAPAINTTYALGGMGNLYAGISAVGAFTRGDGDAGGYTDGSEEDLDNEDLFLGWKSGGLFADSLGEDVFDLSFGRQGFMIGDGLLIYDGDVDQFEKGVYYLAPRDSFERAALLRVNTEPVRGDLFYLKADRDQDKAELWGVNIEYHKERLGTLAAIYFHVLDSAPLFLGARDSMDVFSLRATETPVPGIPDLSFWTQYVRQTGCGSDGKIDAYAWYAEAQYSFTELFWSPTIAYRYAFFSGSDLTDSKRKDFDPFFYGCSRGWGTWYQGEITSSYLLFNSNQINHMIQVSATPNDTLSLTASYWKFSLEADNYYGTPVADDDFADEINIYADWTINDYLCLSAVYGVAFPGDAAEEVFSDDKPYHVFEVMFSVSF